MTTEPIRAPIRVLCATVAALLCLMACQPDDAGSGSATTPDGPSTSTGAGGSGTGSGSGAGGSGTSGGSGAGDDGSGRSGGSQSPDSADPLDGSFTTIETDELDAGIPGVDNGCYCSAVPDPGPDPGTSPDNSVTVDPQDELPADSRLGGDGDTADGPIGGGGDGDSVGIGD
jgi:hypothetical protein